MMESYIFVSPETPVSFLPDQLPGVRALGMIFL